jgi:hypothetical protein
MLLDIHRVLADQRLVFLFQRGFLVYNLKIVWIWRLLLH